MNRSAYVVMKTFDSPIGFVIPSPHCVFDGTKQEVAKFIEGLNAKAVRNRYYACKVKREGK